MKKINVFVKTDPITTVVLSLLNFRGWRAPTAERDLGYILTEVGQGLSGDFRWR